MLTGESPDAVATQIRSFARVFARVAGRRQRLRFVAVLVREFRFRRDLRLRNGNRVERLLQFDAGRGPIRPLAVVDEQRSDLPVDQADILKELRPRLGRANRDPRPPRAVAAARERALRRRLGDQFVPRECRAN